MSEMEHDEADDAQGTAADQTSQEQAEAEAIFRAAFDSDSPGVGIAATEAEGDAGDADEAAKDEGAEDEGAEDSENSAGEPAQPVAAPDPTAEALNKMERRLRTMEGKFGSLNGQVQRQIADLARAQTVRAGGEAPSKAQLAAAHGSAEKMAVLKEEFPEFHDALLSQVEELRGQIAASATQAPAPEVEESGFRERYAKARIEEEHEGWEDTVQTPEFVEWYKAQPEDVRALANSRRPRDAIALLDRFETRPDPNTPAAIDDAGRQGDDPRRATGGRRQAPSRQRRLENAIPATTGGTTRKDRATSEREAFLAGFNEVN